MLGKNGLLEMEFEKPIMEPNVSSTSSFSNRYIGTGVTSYLRHRSVKNFKLDNGVGGKVEDTRTVGFNWSILTVSTRSML